MSEGKSDTKMPAAKPAAATPTCSDCRCFKAAAAPQGNCRRVPPKSFVFLLPSHITGASPVDYNISVWPVVKDTDWCVDGFQPKKGNVQ